MSMQNYAARSSIVICDDELAYACHLQEYLDRRKDELPWPVSIYTDTNLLLGQQRPEETCLLVISESEYQKEVAQAGFQNILILNESNRLLPTDWPNISKYQSMEHILSAIVQLSGEKETASAQTIRHTGNMHWIGFYTPVSRCLQTTFALTLGQILGEQLQGMQPQGEQAGVLYLNFENWPALLPLMDSRPEGSMQELLYFNDCARQKVGGRLQRVARHERFLDLVMPGTDFLQLQQVTAAQWLSLFETIRKVSEYQYLLLDLSESVQGLLEILSHCDHIYTIQRNDDVGKIQMAGYEDFLRTQHAQELAARTKFLQLPVFPALPVRIADYGQGPLADYIRQEQLAVF